MTFSHTTGTYNVHATLVSWVASIYATAVPAVGVALAILLDHPTTPIDPPCVSVHFLGDDSDPSMRFGGMNVGGGLHGVGRFGLLEVDLWASRSAQNWRAQLRQLHDALSKGVISLHSSGGAMPIKDFYTTATSPADTAYLVRIDGIEERGSLPDPNSDIQRKRLILTYSWVERV